MENVDGITKTDFIFISIAFHANNKRGDFPQELELFTFLLGHDEISNKILNNFLFCSVLL